MRQPAQAVSSFATRYEKTARAYLSMLCIAAARLWIKTVNTDWQARNCRVMDDTLKMAKNAPGNGAPSPPRRPARAELVWEGKYDAAGRRGAPLRRALP